MAHLLLFEIPTFNDYRLLDQAAAAGHSMTLLSSDPDYYHRTAPGRLASYGEALRVLPLDLERHDDVERTVLALHARRPVHAVLCLLDICMIIASRVAARLGLPFLNPATASLLRDKMRTRFFLARQGIRQPRFALLRSIHEAPQALERVGFPLVIKPADGVASAGVRRFDSEREREALHAALSAYFKDGLRLGMGAFSSARIVMEQFIDGATIGCDSITCGERHHFLGMHEKTYFETATFVIRGGCFSAGRFDTGAIKSYLFEILNALNFNLGAAHTEMVVTPEGVPYLVEVNARLVGAQMPRLMELALDRSPYRDLIDLHLGRPPDGLEQAAPKRYAVSRWLIARREGVLRAVVPPPRTDARIKEFGVVYPLGARVPAAPRHNGERLAYVMAAGDDRQATERAAEAFIDATEIHFAE
jgi:hypothetical protein